MWRDLRPYLRVLRGYRLRLVAGAALLLLTTVAATGLLALSGWFITATAVTAALWAAGAAAALNIYVPGGGIRAFALTRTAARYAERLYNHDTVLRLLAELRTAVFARLTRLDPATLARFRAATLLNRLTADIDALDTLYLRVLAPPLVALVAVVLLAALLAAFAPMIALVVPVALLILWAAVNAAAARGGLALTERVAAETEALRVTVVAHVEGLAELLAFGSGRHHREAMLAREAGLTADQRRLARRAAAGEAVMLAGIQLAGVTALGLGAIAYGAGTVSAAVVVLMALAVLGLGELFVALPSAFVQLGRVRASARRLTAQVACESALPTPERSTAPPADTGLELAGVSLRYASWMPPVLDGAAMTVASGERVAVTGASGSGKSSVADLCARLIDPTAGEVRLGGVALLSLDRPALRRRLAYLTQRTELFDDTVAANLRIAAPGAGEGALWHALEVADLAAFVEALPDGLATWVGEHGQRLSGGQARRLALARVVLRDAPVVVLDEPFTGLDRETAATVATRLDRWLVGRTAVLLAHDVEALPPVDRVLAVEDGHLRGMA
ncbi:thiol reductant ABC exporter subunit CydC [Arhodomonas aquaeolei]|uniref:thiol reductant ABC exporter subunit CydC n=1 Tax=Arhodomonas aquaeolei TaxID=2369 RepID=UPI0004758761|nr:thiol reductant ABC exporter subunit CydC [Arhodomonas aquaeolei]